MKLAVRTLGSGSRTAALVHGASMNGGIWRDFGAILTGEHDFTLLLVDQRGHGESPRADRYEVPDFAQDLVETLPTGLDLLVGQSLGGFSGALAAGELKPKRFIGLDPAFSASAGAGLVLRYLGPLQPSMPDWMLHALGSPPKGSAPDTLELFRAAWAKWDRSMMGQLVPSGRRSPFVPAPPAVPSTIVLADKSFVVKPAAAAAFAAAGWDVRVKPGAVHDMHVQDPHGLAALLDDVLRA